jgi:biopolymer transport protein TolQ
VSPSEATALTAAQVGGAIPTTPMELITESTGVTQGVLVLLALLSLLSWAIMLSKWLEFRAVARAGRDFMREFEHVSRWEQARSLVRRASPSPFTRVFGRATSFLGEARAGAAHAASASGETAAAATPAPLRGSQVEALRLLLDSEAAAERDQFGRYIPTLATIGSVSPLIGLLGTVLGVISAFVGIATSGSGNIGAVAPGVAEALVATAAALAVAIPAVFGYNIFATRLNRLEGELEAFGTEIVALLAREGLI